MPKFKKGDYVILREDARYPGDGSLWSTIDKSLICGDLFEVELSGSYSWLNKEPCQDCITVLYGVGWMPESCFDPVQIQKFKVGDWVECYRLPNENDWNVTNCGKISHNLKVGEKYEVRDSWDTCNITIVTNDEIKGYYPPTIFRKTTSPIQELPETWCVACKHREKDTPELSDWRNRGWTGEGYIYSNKLWLEKPCDNIISYETFLEKVYKPWKALQSEVVSNSDITSLPDKWVYSLKNESPDRIKLIKEWRSSVCKSYYINNFLCNSYSICNHEDDSYYYAGSSIAYVSSRENVIEINKEMFDKFILQPWIDKGKPRSNLFQEETSKLSDSNLVTTTVIGARVVRGRDWEWETQGSNTTGTIIGDGDSLGWTRVKWDNGHTNSYRIGYDNKYDLYYAEDQIPADVRNYSPTYSEFALDFESEPIILSDTHEIDKTPHLIVNKSKKRLFSTEVQELNVNLKLLKTQ